MSSTITSTQVQTLPSRVIPCKMDNKSARLVRTSSLEKIRRFNSFICSQQYYILPALLTWLRSSQSGLNSSAERTIFAFRSLFFNTFFYNLHEIEFKSIITNNLILVLKRIESTYKNIESTFLLRISIYLTALILVLELGLCFYILCNTHVPSGLVFLIVCWFYIIYLKYKQSMFFTLEQDEVELNFK